MPAKTFPKGSETGGTKVKPPAAKGRNKWDAMGPAPAVGHSTMPVTGAVKRPGSSWDEALAQSDDQSLLMQLIRARLRPGPAAPGAALGGALGMADDVPGAALGGASGSSAGPGMPSLRILGHALADEHARRRR